VGWWGKNNQESRDLIFLELRGLYDLRKEQSMLNVTESATQAVAQYFNTMDVKPVRIYLAQGCGGQQLAMALDEVKSSDAVAEAGGFQFVMEQTLLDQAQPVQIDYADMGFNISSNLELGGGCRSCGTAGSCCPS
jgi:Fe-S cluster assembly iron-binding protein IscA